MKHRGFLCRLAAIVLTVCLMLTGCAAPENTAAAETTAETTTAAETQAAETTAATEAVAAMAETEDDGKLSLSVAIYPYIPDIDLFADVLTRQWAQLEPDVKLNFVEWDCYATPEPTQIDVVMYDALFTSFLAEKGHIQPIAAEDLLESEGILDFAVEGAYHDGQLYGVPYLVCSDFLVYRTEDTEMAAVQNMKQLHDLMMARKQQNPDDGLAIKYDSHYPYYYLDALIDFSGNYTVYEEAPDTTTPDPQVYARLCEIRECLPANVSLEDLMKDSRRCRLFSSGACSAYYGYSEDMSRMDEVQDEISVRTLSFSETENIQLFYADIASMGAHVQDPEKQELCLRLMNLIGSEEFQQELCFGTEDVQYMLPARKAAYVQAQEQYPLYGQLYTLVTDENNRIIRFGTEVHDYLATAYDDLA